MSPDKYVAVALGVYAFGVGAGEFYILSAKIAARRFGRAVKIASTLSAALIALVATFNPVENVDHGLIGFCGAAAIVFGSAVAMMYRLEAAGKLKPVE